MRDKNYYTSVVHIHDILRTEYTRWCIPDRRLAAIVDLQIKIITSMCIIAVHMFSQPPLEYIYSHCSFINSPSTFELALAL